MQIIIKISFKRKVLVHHNKNEKTQDIVTGKDYQSETKIKQEKF